MRTKDRKYYHSEIDVIDIPFRKLKIFDSTKYFKIKETIKEFNISDLENKQRLLCLLPKELFNVCRFCNNIIVNSNSKLGYKDCTKEIFVICPNIKYRIVGNKLHELSCCETCLLEHFKDNVPKSPKYYYMKANRFGAYSFDYSEEEYKKVCSATVAVTRKHMIDKWGKEDGETHWQSYVERQSKTNTFEYKNEKYGISEKEFTEFNKSRAVTKELCIKRHGEENGLKIWQNYCNRQRYTNSKEYFIKEYGENEGTKKYINFSKARANNITKFKSSVSKISVQLFDRIVEELHNHNIYHKIYYGNNKEYFVFNEHGRNYFLDFYDEDANLVIEFQGDYWHANPNVYKAEDVLVHDSKKVLAKDIWKFDELKETAISSILNKPTYIKIWEAEYKLSKNNSIKKILKYYGISD